MYVLCIKEIGYELFFPPYLILSMSCAEIPKTRCQLNCDFLQQQRNICVKNSNGMDQLVLSFCPILMERIYRVYSY